MKDLMQQDDFAKAIQLTRDLNHLLIMRGFPNVAITEDLHNLEEQLREDLYRRHGVQVP